MKIVVLIFLVISSNFIFGTVNKNMSKPSTKILVGLNDSHQSLQFVLADGLLLDDLEDDVDFLDSLKIRVNECSLFIVLNQNKAIPLKSDYLKSAVRQKGNCLFLLNKICVLRL